MSFTPKVFIVSIALFQFACGFEEPISEPQNNRNDDNPNNRAKNQNNANNKNSVFDIGANETGADSGQNEDGGEAIPDLVDVSGEARAFPGAQGFGTESVCGRGGEVFVVNNQSDLDSCIGGNGPRVCVFAVSGTFTPVEVRNPFITIAGESAPSPGVQFTSRLTIRTHDVCVRHLRVRGNGRGDTLKLAFQNDGLDQNEQTYNIVLDHLSVSWSGDENISSWAGPGNAVNGQPGTPSGRVSNVTISNTISSEGIAPHSMGFLAARPGHDRFSIISSVFVNNNGRNPKTGSGKFTVVNNLTYNHSGAAIRMGSSGGVFDGVAVGNAIVTTGPNSGSGSAIGGTTGNNAMNFLYVADNAVNGIVSGNAWEAVEWAGANLTQNQTLPDWWSEASITPIPSSRVYDHNIACSGARPKDRDSVDTRVINDIVAGIGAIPSTVPQLPNLDGGSHTLSPIFTTPSDFDLDTDDDGYTDVEEALHDMALQLECDE